MGLSLSTQKAYWSHTSTYSVRLSISTQTSNCTRKWARRKFLIKSVSQTTDTKKYKLRGPHGHSKLRRYERNSLGCDNFICQIYQYIILPYEGEMKFYSHYGLTFSSLKHGYPLVVIYPTIYSQVHTPTEEPRKCRQIWLKKTFKSKINLTMIKISPLPVFFLQNL